MKLNCTTGTQVGEGSVGAGRADVGLHGPGDVAINTKIT